MTKTELIHEVSKATETTQAVVGKVLNAALETITNDLSQGNKVILTGFGTFYVKDCAEREYRNPRTGEKVIALATKRPAFKAGRGFKEKIVL